MNSCIRDECQQRKIQHSPPILNLFFFILLMIKKGSLEPPTSTTATLDMLPDSQPPSRAKLPYMHASASLKGFIRGKGPYASFLSLPKGRILITRYKQQKRLLEQRLTQILAKELPKTPDSIRTIYDSLSHQALSRAATPIYSGLAVFAFSQQ